MLDGFKSEQSPKTPLIELNGKTGVFELKGKSIPENTSQFYRPMFNWIEKYILHPSKTTTLNIQLEYFNSSSAKALADLFKIMAQLNKSSKSEVVVNWYYQENDEDIQEAGEDFESITKIPFNFISFP